MTATKTAPAKSKTVIYESYTMDYTAQVHFAQRDDGQWFTRIQQRGHWGYCWTAWRPVSAKPENARVGCYPRYARLPKA